MSEEIRIGDRFLVEVEVQRFTSDVIVCSTCGGPTAVFSEGTLLSAKRLPRALKPGDRVCRRYTPSTVAVGTIIAKHANKTWVDLGHDTVVWLTADLTLAEDTAS